METKECSRCKETKPVSEFHKATKAADGLQGFCKACAKTAYDKWREDNREAVNERMRGIRKNWTEERRQHSREWQRDYNREKSRFKKYGITKEQYLQMVEDQEGLCAICRKPYDWENSALYIDHCHTTGKVRGLLCRTCNKGLGYFHDDVAVLARAIEYLKKATEV